jgi:hypothetical protein
MKFAFKPEAPRRAKPEVPAVGQIVGILHTRSDSFYPAIVSMAKPASFEYRMFDLRDSEIVKGKILARSSAWKSTWSSRCVTHAENCVYHRLLKQIVIDKARELLARL